MQAVEKDDLIPLLRLVVPKGLHSLNPKSQNPKRNAGSKRVGGSGLLGGTTRDPLPPDLAGGRGRAAVRLGTSNTPLDPSPYTLHPTPSLHPTLYTLHPVSVRSGSVFTFLGFVA